MPLPLKKPPSKPRQSEAMKSSHELEYMSQNQSNINDIPRTQFIMQHNMMSNLTKNKGKPVFDMVPDFQTVQSDESKVIPNSSLEAIKNFVSDQKELEMILKHL